MIRKPSILNIIVGAARSFLSLNESLEHSGTPKRVGRFNLVSILDKARENPYRNFEVGIYEFAEKKYFIKTWQGRVKDTNYYSLINEYLVTGMLYKKTKSVGELKFAQPIDIVESKDRLSAVYEFIVGQNLDKENIEKQAEVINKIIKSLQIISNSLTEKEKNQLTKRSIFFYLIFLPLLTLMLMIRGKNRKIIFSQFVKSVFNTSFFNKELTLAHRDLDPNNILISGKLIYLLDNERVVLTLPNYDFTNLLIYKGRSNLTKLISKKYHLKTDDFLKTFITFHYTVNNIKDIEFRKYYFNFLKQNYG